VSQPSRPRRLPYESALHRSRFETPLRPPEIMKKRIVVAGLLATAVAACSVPPTGAGGPSFLRAAVDGAVVDTFEGRASFHVGTPGPGRQQFQLSSYGSVRTGPSFAITRWNGGRLAVGSYPLGLVDLGDSRTQGSGPLSGITLQYFHTDEEFEAQFVAYEGVLEITHSTRNRVEGTFTFSAERYCLRERIRSNPPREPVGPCTPQSVRLGAPEIRVSGTFSATPLVIGPIETRRF
jgi:hypothetical protein